MRRLALVSSLASLFVFAAACGPEPEAVVPPPPPPPPPTMTTPPPAPPPTATPEDPNATFAAFSAKYLADLFALDPAAATQAGEHAHDAEWPDMSREGTAKLRAFYAAAKSTLAALPREPLDESNRIDLAILQNQIDYALFQIDELKTLDVNPLATTQVLGDGLDPLVTREFAPIEERMKSLEGRLNGVPAVVAAAKARLAHTPKVFTETAIAQNKGLVDLVKHELAATFAKVPAQKAALEAAAAKASAALDDFQTFLEKDLLARSDGDFRLGRAKFEKKLRYELGDEVDIDALAKSARELVDKTREEMVATSLELWPTLFPNDKAPKHDSAADKRALVKKALDKLAEDRPTNATIVEEAKRLLGETSRFVKAHDLVRFPDEPCAVIEMPEYRRGVAVAYCESTGPFEKKQETYYAIAPTPKDWKKPRVESFYKEYNRSMLADLTIHEAMPGHFLQAMHNNRVPSKVRAYYSSGAFVEGWAVYGEWLMAKYGFGGPKVRLERQKMMLRAAANAVLDHGIHAGHLEEKEALELMQKEAFQEEGEAVGKWKRARLSSAQLTTYYYGFSEMMRIRAGAEGKPGFTERAFHDRLLAYGAPTMKLARELMAVAPSVAKP